MAEKANPDDVRWVARRISDRVTRAIIQIEGEVTGERWMTMLRGVNAKYRLVSTRYDQFDQGHYSLTPLGISLRTHLLENETTPNG